MNAVFKEAFKQAFALIHQNLKLYLVLNILYYGLIAAAMAYVFAYPQVQQELMAATMTEASQEIPGVFNAYVSGNFAVAVIGTFLVNLTLGTLVWITLPSLLVPFGGVALGGIRALLWGLLFAPTTPMMAERMTYASLVLVFKGQAYVLAMLAAFIHWRGIIWPANVGETKRLRAYFAGLKKTLRLYLLIIVILALIAVYEAYIVIFIGGRLI